MKVVQSEEDRGGRRPEAATAADPLHKLLAQATSLTGSESKTLTALLRLRTGTLKQLSESTGISQSNICPVLDSLSTKGLCQRFPGRYAIWACTDPDEVFGLLHKGEQERLNASWEATEQGLADAKTLLYNDISSEAVPDGNAAVMDIARMVAVYEEALKWVESARVLNRGPYVGELEPDPDGAVMKALRRGLVAKALYQQDELDAPDGALRRAADTFARAGAELRVVERIPAGAALLGSNLALLNLDTEETSLAEPQYGIVVRNERLVELIGEAFERLWERATPYAPTLDTSTEESITEEVSV